MSEGKDPRVLEPTKLDVNKFRKADTATTDQFGQQYNSDYDQSKWSNVTPADSRRQHARADTDMSPRSLHHTLGIKHSQASPGDHIHDGTTSKKIGPLQMVTGGATEAVWTIPSGYVITDIVNLLRNFIEVRVLGSPAVPPVTTQEDTVVINFTTLSSFTQTITFPVPYAAGVVPAVMTNIASGAGGIPRWGSRAINVTNTQFTLFLFKGDAVDAAATFTDIPVQWMSYSN